MTRHIRREITPISNSDFYVLQNHFNAQFDYPIHYHPEFELNLVFNTYGKRIIGDAIESYRDLDIVLVGSNTLHAWTNESKQHNARVITIQFAPDFLNKNTLSREVMKPVKELLDSSQHGIAFEKGQLLILKKKILRLAEMSGFEGVLAFFQLLYDMAVSPYRLILPHSTTPSQDDNVDNLRILEACYYIQKHFKEKISINEVADLISMSPSAFSHFFKRRTYRSFTDYLIDLRVSNACKMLLETDISISNISDSNGFRNLSNFNKIFKKRKQLTPKEFRKIGQKMRLLRM